jgi:hypothetical protein
LLHFLSFGPITENLLIVGNQILSFKIFNFAARGGRTTSPPPAQQHHFCDMMPCRFINIYYIVEIRQDKTVLLNLIRSWISGQTD